MKKPTEENRRRFAPAPGSPRWMFILPYAVLIVLAVILLAGGAYGWDYTNSPKFCGTTCHTMPPQDATYKVSPHANVYCTECHIGRAFVGTQFARKSEDVREIYAMVFHTYEFPIQATRSRPARETCEKCHLPETFSDDSLRVITEFANDEKNTASNIYLVLKTGGGAKREGLGRGIHWHIVNKVEYYAADALGQDIPYVRVTNDDGSTTEYVNADSSFDPAALDQSQLKEMDCVTCHNRVSHDFKPPVESVNLSMSRGLISPDLPNIRGKAVDALSAAYASREEAMAAFDTLGEQYKAQYPGRAQTIDATIQEIKNIYERTVFPDQKVDWTTHPNNIGHVNSPGCFRCHDGRHVDAQGTAIRLECNACHSIPVVSSPEKFITNIEIANPGLEPDSHLNPVWIKLHYKSVDASCAGCHTTGDPGGVSNTSFCSNSACHGNVFTFAGLNAPKLRAELPPPVTPTPIPTEVVAPAYDANIGPLLASACGACHGTTASGGLMVTTYADLMKGGKDGAVIVPGDSSNSLLVKIQSETHYANLAAEQLDLVKQWIDSGAPEK